MSIEGPSHPAGRRSRFARVGCLVGVGVVLVVAVIAVGLVVVTRGRGDTAAAPRAIDDNAARFAAQASVVLRHRPITVTQLDAIAARSYRDVASGGLALGFSDIAARQDPATVTVTFQVSVTGVASANGPSIDRACREFRVGAAGLVTGYPKKLDCAALLPRPAARQKFSV